MRACGAAWATGATDGTAARGISWRTSAATPLIPLPLEALRTQDHLARRDFKGFFVELSEILRWYVGAQYGFESVELTVAELSGELAKRRTPGLDLAHLRRVLDEADLVKFAKYAPDDLHAHAALNAAFEVVERTTPRGPVEEDGHAA